MGMGTPGYVLPGTVGPREQERQQGYIDQFNAAATAPIPGITPGYGVGAPGLLGEGPPPQQVLPPQMSQMPMSQFQAAGPYGRQAAMMAGLLAQPMPGEGYPGGLLGGKRSFRPGGK